MGIYIYICIYHIELVPIYPIIYIRYMGPYILDMLVPVIFPYHEGTNVRNRCAAKVQTLAGENRCFCAPYTPMFVAG